MLIFRPPPMRLGTQSLDGMLKSCGMRPPSVLENTPYVAPTASLVSVTDGFAISGVASWPVNSVGDFTEGTGTVEVIDNIAFLTIGANTVDWPVDGVTPDDGPGDFLLSVTDGIGYFTPDNDEFSMPVDS